jgi:ketosteroid isomerase-like protein
VSARPEDVHPALAAVYNAGDLDGVVALYAPDAAFVIKPGQVTDGPAELRAVLQRLVGLGAHLEIEPQAYVRSGDVVLVTGRYVHSGYRRDGTPFEVRSRFADVLGQQPDGRWLIAVDDGVSANL